MNHTRKIMSNFSTYVINGDYNIDMAEIGRAIDDYLKINEAPIEQKDKLSQAEYLKSFFPIDTKTHLGYE